MSDLVPRRDGSPTLFNASDALAAVVEMYGLPLTERQRSRLAKSAKELLSGGYQPRLVCQAMLVAIQRGRVDLVSEIALDLQSASHGIFIDPRTYQEGLKRLNEKNDPRIQRIAELLERS